MNIPTQLIFGSLNIPAPPPLSSSMLIAPLPLSARNGQLYLVSNQSVSNVINVNLTPFINNLSPVLDTIGGNFTITGNYLNFYRADNSMTNIQAQYYSTNANNFKYQFTAVPVDPQDNTQMVLVYPQGIAKLSGQLSIDLVGALGQLTPNYNATVMVSYGQMDNNDPTSMTMTVDNYVKSMSNIFFTNVYYLNYYDYIAHNWISNNTLVFNLKQSTYIGSPLTMFFSPDSSYSYNTFVIYPLPSIYVNNGVGVPLGGGNLPVSQDKTYCTNKLQSCTIADKLVNGPFDCNSIPIPAGIGLQIPINCTDTSGNQLLTKYIYFNYGPSVSNNIVNKNVLVVDGIGFDTGSTSVKFSDGSVVQASPQSTTTQAFFVFPRSTPITGTFILTSSGQQSGSYIYKGKPYIQSVTLENKNIVGNESLIGYVQLRIIGSFITLGASSQVMVGSQVCTVIGNNNYIIECWMSIPAASPVQLPVVITIDSSTQPTDPFDVLFDLATPTIVSITPTYTQTSTQLNIVGTFLNQSILLDSGVPLIAQQSQYCTTVNDTLITCTIQPSKGEFSVVHLGVSSNSLVFDYQPVISNTSSLNGSTLEVNGVNFSPYLYFSMGSQSTNPVSVTSTKAIFQFPEWFFPGSYQICSSGFYSDNYRLSLHPVINDIEYDGRLSIYGYYLSVVDLDGKTLNHSISVNNQSAYLTQDDNRPTRSVFYPNQNLVASDSVRSVILTTTLIINNIASNSFTSSPIPLPYLDRVVYTQDSGTHKTSTGTFVFTGTTLEHLPYLYYTINGEGKGDWIANSTSTGFHYSNMVSVGEAIYTFQLSWPPMTSNNISIHILKPTLERIYIREQTKATVMGRNIVSKFIRFGSYQPTDCEGGGFNSNMTTCNLSQCEECLSTCNTFTYNNGMTSFSKIFYPRNPVLMLAVSNGTQVNVTATLSCNQTIVPNLLELLSIKVGYTQCESITKIGDNIFSCQAKVTSGSVSLSLLEMESNTIPLVYIDPTPPSSSSSDEPKPQPSSSSKLLPNLSILIIIIYLSLTFVAIN
ncbi:hypothetical protein SAMD00019534_087170 [Acytostelium subglobosum LB1]|uniref:hypothetical protein n=1 Tax=Acytostelium subglobosum LB1 TaxID=1410327 RepID=UPI0006448F0E|nr:hypothetical protein SAMD00019534_087170 [Acytostelium subglobosum LB1]GAM25542.1 hypothetical protein SAMD00019534_087170 [Acytostelium subglobosum LB1]|eukprot:XP_012751528.1 hypothetical protein SAMD00019534_087170 [Acytostelium subglobosum LB1]